MARFSSCHLPQNIFLPFFSVDINVFVAYTSFFTQITVATMLAVKTTNAATIKTITLTTSRTFKIVQISKRHGSQMESATNSVRNAATASKRRFSFCLTPIARSIAAVKIKIAAKNIGITFLISSKTFPPYC